MAQDSAKCEVSIKHHQEILDRIEKNRHNGKGSVDADQSQVWHRHALIAFKQAKKEYDDGNLKSGDLHMQNAKKASDVANKRYS